MACTYLVEKSRDPLLPLRQMETIEYGPFEFHDKIPLKKNFAEQKLELCHKLLPAMGVI